MRYLDIGAAPKISKIGLGTWQFGAKEWGYGHWYAGQEAKEIVGRAIDLGVTLFDSAEIYGFGRSERILGEALGGRRAPVFLATKIFPLVPVAPVVEQPVRPQQPSHQPGPVRQSAVPAGEPGPRH
jgi:aryl-alcohol dehydrogenase-like predicted oxidoreductase